jgi:hypothetical protein
MSEWREMRYALHISSGTLGFMCWRAIAFVSFAAAKLILYLIALVGLADGQRADKQQTKNARRASKF